MNKLILYLFILSFIGLTDSCNKNKNRKLLAEKIEYDVQINNEQLAADSGQVNTDWWVKNIEGSKREALLNKLAAGLSSGKLKAYNYNTDEQISLNVSQLENVKHINKLRFTEKWYINPKTLEFEKKILSICPLMTKDTNDIPLFRIKQDTIISEDNIHPISERIQYDVNIYNEQRKTNNEQPYWWKDNIETSKRVQFIDYLLNSAFSGKFITYDYFNEPENAKKLKKEFYWTENLSLYRSNPPYDKYDTIIKHGIENNQITRLRFMEEWYLDNNSLAIIKKVKGICPIIKRYREDGEFKGFMPMFWIYTDKKYPIKK